MCAVVCEGCCGCAMLAAYFMLTSHSDVTVRVLVALYFAGAIFCLGASTVFHAFNCYSEAAYRLLIKYVVWLVIDWFMQWYVRAERFACTQLSIYPHHVAISVASLGLVTEWLACDSNTSIVQL